MHKIIYNKTNWRSEHYHFHLDLGSEITTPLIVKGWFVNKSAINLTIRVVDENHNFLKVVDTLKIRPRLTDMYPEIEGVNKSGFQLNTIDFKTDKDYSIGIYDGEKQVINLASFVNNLPLLYVHIPKTAGSTVNKVLSEWFGDEYSLIHAESKVYWKESVKQNKLGYLSGHIPYIVFSKMKLLSGFKKAITFREPYPHVISHLSWIRALALTENRQRYEAHPEYIQILSDKLASYDLSCPEHLANAINSFNRLEHRLLDNTQTRYIRSELAKVVVDEADLVDAVENLKHFDFVGTDNDISGFLAEISAGYGIEYKIEDRRENVLNNKFGLDINNPDIKEALLPLVKYDLKLYDAVQGLSRSN
jgi:hypothetical protein